MLPRPNASNLTFALLESATCLWSVGDADFRTLSLGLQNTRGLNSTYHFRPRQDLDYQHPVPDWCDNIQPRYGWVGKY